MLNARYSSAPVASRRGDRADDRQPVLRVRPETSCEIAEFSEHQADGGEAEEGEFVPVAIFPGLGQPAAATQPPDGALNNPSFGQDDEAFGLIGTADDFGNQ